MRPSQRHARRALTTVLGLSAPALAALLFSSNAQGLAAPLPTAAAPVAQPVAVASPAAAHHAAAKKVARKHTAKPAVHRTASTAPTVHHVTVVAAAPAPGPVAPPPPAPAPAPSSTSTSQTAQPSGVDDYPFKSASVDSWGFTARQCVSFAAWRLHQYGHDMGANAGATWGSAYQWASVASSKGYLVTSTPRVGAIAQWGANESSAYYGPGSATANGTFTAGGYGHVAWVKSVYADGSVLVEQYNMGGSQAYSVMRVRAPRYIVF